MMTNRGSHDKQDVPKSLVRFEAGATIPVISKRGSLHSKRSFLVPDKNGYSLYAIRDEDGELVEYPHRGCCLWLSETMAEECAKVKIATCELRSHIVVRIENLSALEAIRGLRAGIEYWGTYCNKRCGKFSDDMGVGTWCVKVHAISPEGTKSDGYVSCDALTGRIGFSSCLKCSCEELLEHDGCCSCPCSQYAPLICIWKNHALAEKCLTCVQKAYQTLGWHISYLVKEFDYPDDYCPDDGCVAWIDWNKAGQDCLYLCLLLEQNEKTVSIDWCGEMGRRGCDDPTALLNGSLALNDWMLSWFGLKDLKQRLLMSEKSEMRGWTEWAVRDAVHLASTNQEWLFAACFMKRSLFPVDLRLKAFVWSSLSFVTDDNYNLWHPYAELFDKKLAELELANEDYLYWENLPEEECLKEFQSSGNRIACLAMILKTGKVNVFESLCSAGLPKMISTEDLIYLVCRHSERGNYCKCAFQCLSAIEKVCTGSIEAFRDGEGNGVMWYAVPRGVIIGRGDVWDNYCEEKEYKEFMSKLENFGCDPNMKNSYGMSMTDLLPFLNMGDYWYDVAV